MRTDPIARIVDWLGVVAAQRGNADQRLLGRRVRTGRLLQVRTEPAERLIDTVAWVLIEGGRILCARPRGKGVFYIPGGKREGGESDLQTLLREIDEELTVALRPETATHVGTYEAELPGAAGLVRMACYTAEYVGTLTPSSEIDELAWFTYADRPHVPPVDQLLFDDLAAAGLLPDS